MTAESTQSLVYRCQQGQLDAFSALFTQHQNLVYDIACTILRDEVEAEDVVQDTFLAVFRKIDGYIGQSTFETWLVAIAVNQCRMRLRKRRIRQLFSLDQLTPGRLLGLSDRDEVANLVQKRQCRKDLWAMVGRLDDRLRLPMILRYRYAYSCGNIALVLDRRKSTIYQYLHEGRRVLEEMVQQQEVDSQATPVEVAG